MLGVGLAVVALSVLTALALPAVYRSTATILIQEQDIPQELIRSTITSYADERIQVIAQQVMTRSTLLALVERNDLYARARLRETTEEIVQRMRRDTQLLPISAEVTDRRTGTPARATIAFSLSYDGDSAASAQKIANELTSLFLSENLRSRQQRALETTSFLVAEGSRLEARISELEARLAEFRQRHQGRTPELSLANALGAERTETELRRIEREMAFVQERMAATQAQLLQTRPHAPLGLGAATLEPDERLRALRLQLSSARAAFSESHPDVRRLQREVALLESQLEPSTGQQPRPQASAADEQLALARVSAQLDALRQRYAEGHPDVQRLVRVRAALQEAGRAAGQVASAPAAARADEGLAPRMPDNPAFLGLKSQLEVASAQLTLLRNERQELQERLKSLSARTALAPRVEQEYQELTRDLDTSRALFRQLREKQALAESSEQLERSRKAERFTVIEPAALPERPQRPNRGLILALGLMLALLAAGLSVALLETLDRRVGDARDVERVLLVPVLAEWAPTDRPGVSWRVLAVATSLLLAAVAAALTAVHVWVMPLDVAWFSFLRRSGL